MWLTQRKYLLSADFFKKKFSGICDYETPVIISLIIQFTPQTSFTFYSVFRINPHSLGWYALLSQSAFLV